MPLAVCPLPTTNYDGIGESLNTIIPIHNFGQHCRVSSGYIADLQPLDENRNCICIVPIIRLTLKCSKTLYFMSCFTLAARDAVESMLVASLSDNIETKRSITFEVWRAFQRRRSGT